MTTSILRRVAIATALCLSLALPALAQDAAAVRPAAEQPLQKAIGQRTTIGPVPSLFVLNARGATLADGKLTLTGFSPNSIVFADRPVRAAGHIDTAQFVESWLQGEDQFDIDPPNATVSVLGGDGSVADAVVTISAPLLAGDSLTFDAVVLEGALTGAAGPAALFIDRGGFGGGRGGGGMARGGGDFRGDGGGEDHLSNYSHVQNPHAGWYRSDDGSNNRTVNYDPHYNNNYHGGGYNDGGYPWGAGAAGFAAGAALGAAENPYPYAQCGYPPYPPCN